MATLEMDGWITRVLGVALPEHDETGEGTAPSGTGGKPVGLVQFAKLRLAWNDAKNRVASDLGGLHKTVLDEFGDDPLSQSISRLDEVLGRFQEGLGDRLDDLANAATPEARGKMAKESEAIAAKYLAYVLDDPLIDLVETNPFGDLVISGRLAPTLTEIRRALGTIAA